MDAINQYKELTNSLVDTTLLSESVQQALLGMSATIEAAGLNQTKLSGIAASILDSLHFDMSMDAVIPAEKARAVVEEVKSYLPVEVTEEVENKFSSAQTAGNNISRSDWIAIIGIIVPVLIALAGWALSLEHDQKEEAAWCATAEYQQESLEIQRQNAKQLEEFQQCVEEHFKVAEEHFKITEETNERIAQALELLADQGIKLDNQGEAVVDLPDFPDDADDQGVLQERPDSEK